MRVILQLPFAPARGCKRLRRAPRCTVPAKSTDTSCGLKDGAQASRYQSASCQVLLSQPVSSQTSLSLAPATPGRATTGMTTLLFTANSLHLIRSAARLTGSSSTWAALWVSSYSGLDQRVILRPCHLLALVDTSVDRNWRRKTSGSGC